MAARKGGGEMTDKDSLVENLQSLVKIPSFRDSIAISRWIKNALEGIGYKVWSDEDGNMMAEIGAGPGFLLNAHMDTVDAGDGWKHDPFGGEIDKGRVYGCGSSDCKAGIASMLEIARIMKENPPKKRVVFAFTAFEESYPLERNGVYRILPRLEDIEKGLILEPTTHGKTIGIAVGCRGNGFYELDVLGKKGHSGYPQHADNAIYKVPKLLLKIDKFPKRKMKVSITGEEIENSLVVTEICAKEGGNVVPGKCTMTLNTRLLPDDKPEEVLKKLHYLCRDSFGKYYALQEKVVIGGYLFEDREFLEMCKEAITSINCEPKPYFKTARVDGGILHNFAGIGTFVLGPGDIANAHQKDEYCAIEDLHRGTEAILGVIKRWDRS
ncbi:MAG: M20/M25/M40 family metallo-hydrolase [Candidatus Aenigmatarchaeota archaeon]|nr:MAG: M20/M25/M40 family metallo-hydrolase [Candidatus Aenigmarchaeota archaeon]